jgi:DNA-binding transcriptional LysR family regulator
MERERDRIRMDSYLALMAFVAAGLGIAGVLLWVYFPW